MESSNTKQKEEKSKRRKMQPKDKTSPKQDKPQLVLQEAMMIQM